MICRRSKVDGREGSNEDEEQSGRLRRKRKTEVSVGGRGWG